MKAWFSCYMSARTNILFTGRHVAITLNNVKNRNHAVMIFFSWPSAVRSAFTARAELDGGMGTDIYNLYQSPTVRRTLIPVSTWPPLFLRLVLRSSASRHIHPR